MVVEQHLWMRFLEGDKKAFSHIYTLYIDELFSYGMKLCADMNLVKDCIQDIFIVLFEHRQQLSEPKNIKYYLFKVLKRTIFRKLKKEARNGGFAEVDALRFHTDYNIESTIINREIDNAKKRMMAQLIGELTAKQQEILYLRFTMGFDYLEIAKILQIDHNSVRKQVYRAIKCIRKNPTFKNHLSLILFYSSLFK